MTLRPPALRIEALTRAAAIATLPHELDALAARALEDNVFVEALMLVPALELIDRDVELTVVCLRDKANLLVGVATFVVEPLKKGVPLKVLRSWSHRYCFLGTPLLDAAAARSVLEALADWIASGSAPAGGIEWAKISWDGPFGQLINEIFAPSRGWLLDTIVERRAVLERSAPPVSATSGRHAKEHRRLERRLAERGTLSYERLAQPTDWQAWFEEFLDLEASGWKGKAGSAISSKPEDREFFRRVVGQAATSGQLQMLAMRLNGRAIAMKLNLRARATSFSLKIAHDERYAQYSPGVLLELFNIEAFGAEPSALLRMDSCADPHHTMIDRLWEGRREIAFVTAAHRGFLLRAFVRLRPLVRGARRKLRAGAATRSGKKTPMPELPTSRPWLNLDANEIRSSFERAPFLLRHTLCDHPLLQLPRLIALARSLPQDSAEFNRADLTLDQEYLKTPKTGLSVEETLYQIESCNSWMALKNVEQDPQYRALLAECVDELRPYTEPIAPGTCKLEAFIFVSSPQAVTPYHCDQEHNFLLQIRGSKRMAVLDREDNEAITQPQLEAMASGAHRNLPFREALHGRETLFNLHPGDGLHVPVHCPHWVQVDDKVSVSLSITFRSQVSIRRDAALRFNARLRRWGLSPTKPGRWIAGDGLKHYAERVLERVERMRGSNA